MGCVLMSLELNDEVTGWGPPGGLGCSQEQQMHRGRKCDTRSKCGSRASKLETDHEKTLGAKLRG